MSTMLLDQDTRARLKPTAELDAPRQRQMEPAFDAGPQALDSELWDSEMVRAHDDDGGTDRPREAAMLDEAIAGAWRRLELGEAVSCPICGGSLDLYRFDEIEAREGFCADCGSELS
jgi:hypothetical protein